MARPQLRRARRLLGAVLGLRALVAVGLLVVVLSYVLAGAAGLLLSLSLITVAGVMAAPARVPAAPPVQRRVPRAVPVGNGPYRSFRRVDDRLSWAHVSPRHYDVVTRPLLQRLMASRLAERHGIDVHRSPEAAQRAVGEDVWPWLDPSRPASSSSQPPGVDAATLARLVERIEAL